MNTRKMTERITFFSKNGKQNEDGEIIEPISTDVYSCWADVSGMTVRDFKTLSGLETGKDTKVFVIRYHPKPPFDNSMYIRFRGTDYKITEIHVDHADKEYISVKAITI
ncbi:phage head closure protein [Streptococcus suis]|uniref:phage head closure protein n=1 Tax=Streptococcus suis TaxID=1307 RepID=UPI000C185363|nr:phage head closure protein [Streptococcus suis]